MLSLALSLGLRAVLLGAGATHEPSAPETAGLELRWEAPPQCPDRAQLLAAIDATLGEVSEGERRPLRVRGRVRAEPPAGFVVRLELDDGRASTRELRGASCQELTEAAALVIAMTIDPRLLETLGTPEVPEPIAPEDERGENGTAGGGAAGSGEVPAEPSRSGSGTGETSSGGSQSASGTGETTRGGPQSASGTGDTSSGASQSRSAAAAGTSSEVGRGKASDAASDRDASDSRGLAERSGGTASDAATDRALASRRRPEPLRFLGRVQAGVGGGPLPGAAGVLGLAAGLGGRGWRAELSASYWTPRTRTSSANPAVGVRAQLWVLGVHGCGEPRWRTLSFPLCAGVLAGAVHARGVGDLVSRSIASRWVAVALEPGVVWWARPRLGLALRAEGHAALARPELRSEPSGTVFRGSSVGGAIRAGVELRMP